MLAAQEWKEADHETYRVMLQVVGREQNGWMKKEQLLNFPCTTIQRIDHLWLQHSNNKFGFSVQQRIWHSIDSQRDKFDAPILRRFGDKVGWRRNNDWLRYDDFSFNFKAYEGHLPSFGFGYSGQRWHEWELSFRSFFPHVCSCLQEKVST